MVFVWSKPGGVAGDAQKIAISPRAYKLARDRNMDVAALNIAGTGPLGRIVARDVLTLADVTVFSPHGQNPAPLVSTGPYQNVLPPEKADDATSSANQPQENPPQQNPPQQNPLGALMSALEAISKDYATKAGFARTPDWFLLKLQEEMGELTQVYLKSTARSAKVALNGAALDAAHEALANELGDVFGQLLLLAHALGVDPVSAVSKKWGVNSP